ncbi:helix-turn-helix domain-containing protein [Chryseobacterium sp. G0186]|uniref:helix-turn-helix domain-containing protein n=1 Tax=Chryseobacterium sp. G0186 TaxID=2487064 RepID=UPI000F515003|nr:helix-turn-helix domain-containing protein [Chryseobacterium sp. G0186]AZA79214.1 helix-turn-helix domain-containing protein [Chryseobacterium sp. G0186]
MKYLQLLFFVVFGITTAQTVHTIDSLKGYSYLDLENKFYDYNYEGKSVESNLIASYYLQKAKRENNNTQIAEGYAYKCINENKENAFKYIDSMALVAKRIHDNVYPARVYLLRANIFFKYDHQKEALDNYIIGLKYARQKGNKRQVALAETNIAYLNSYIGKHAEAAKVLRYYLDNADYLHENEIEKIRTNLADTYIEINKMDSANILINEGLEAFKNKDTYKYNQYLSLSAFYNLKLGKFHRAADSANNSKEFFLNNGDTRDVIYSFFYLGQAYAGLQQKEKAVENFAKVDSIAKKNSYTFPEQREVYTYLIDYYKTKENKQKQLYYIDRFLEIDKVLDSEYKYLSKELQRKYDTPKLLAEKQAILQEIKTKKYLFYALIGALSLLLITAIILFLKARKAEKRHRKIAQDLIRSVEENKAQISEIENREAQTETTDFTTTAFSMEPKSPIGKQFELIEVTDTSESPNKPYKSLTLEATEPILEALKKFENKEQYLEKGLTLGKLAKSINTNTSYLSEVINVYKEKNFTSYINDLRIDYALNRLVHDKKFRSYKLPAISEEIGYNSVQAFHMAFKKKTGTTPSIYIKEIERQNHV